MAADVVIVVTRLCNKICLGLNFIRAMLIVLKFNYIFTEDKFVTLSVVKRLKRLSGEHVHLKS